MPNHTTQDVRTIVVQQTTSDIISDYGLKNLGSTRLKLNLLKSLVDSPSYSNTEWWDMQAERSDSFAKYVEQSSKTRLISTDAIQQNTSFTSFSCTNFGPNGLSSLPRLYTCIKSWKNVHKSRGQRYFLKHAASDQSDKTFLLPSRKFSPRVVSFCPGAISYKIMRQMASF